MLRDILEFIFFGTSLIFVTIVCFDEYDGSLLEFGQRAIIWISLAFFAIYISDAIIDNILSAFNYNE